MLRPKFYVKYIYLHVYIYPDTQNEKSHLSKSGRNVIYLKVTNYAT